MADSNELSDEYDGEILMITYFYIFLAPDPNTMVTGYDPGPLGTPEITPSDEPLKHSGNPLKPN